MASAAPAAPKEKFRKDYQPYPFAMDGIELNFDLRDDVSTVTATMKLRRTGSADAALELDGEDLETVSIAIDGQVLAASRYAIDGERLTIDSVPAAFTLQTVVRIHPENNLQLSGLYRSNGVYCTQCEAEGFRRITWSVDRPDVMATYRVRLESDRHSCPVLLSNGNLVEAGDAGEGRHYSVWEDPFKKPSYLFALVAGDLGVLEDRFTTMHGRVVDLAIYSEHRNVDRLQHAMDSLKRSMVWDEEQFGLEYDLDIYNIVAVEDFNMGAMENKSLNVFNTAYVLARPDTATDADFENIEGVIGHEYFHNWTGNRVTCKDWFQLTLKEGLTVYRDQRFSADMGSPAVRRIEAVRTLRAGQFPEDAGPMAHPIRPESYIAMDNFYTATVYLKGAEVVRMYESLLGVDGFRKGMDLYFERHDGEAVTCDDFRAAMADANGIGLDQFERWYAQAGTPIVHAQGVWEAESGSYTLTLSQECPATPGQNEKQPFHIPVAAGLIGKDGGELAPTRTLELSASEHSFTFEGISSQPVPSVLRGFSAPVRLKMNRSDEDLAILLAHDTDSFCRWEAGQELASRVILNQLDVVARGVAVELPQHLETALRGVLAIDEEDLALIAYALTLPAEAALANELAQIDPLALRAARSGLRAAIGKALSVELAARYEDLAPTGGYVFTPQETGRRCLRNACLAYLVASNEMFAIELAEAQYHAADNMTDALAALACLADSDSEARARCLADFEARWKGDALVMDKWFALQAGAARVSVLEEVIALQSHASYSVRNPNKVRSLLRSFAANASGFHRHDGQGHAFLADRILELDSFNPQIASRLVAPLGRWKQHAEPWASSMRAQLERVQAHGKLSKDTYEMVSKSLSS
ncbi:MAG: aminopeptidase N [Planctomycetes bacterium]|nr:aminopeptidase N [Planctomycetota bacterium]